jgi:hypothetical protein
MTTRTIEYEETNTVTTEVQVCDECGLDSEAGTLYEIDKFPEETLHFHESCLNDNVEPERVTLNDVTNTVQPEITSTKFLIFDWFDFIMLLLGVSLFFVPTLLGMGAESVIIIAGFGTVILATSMYFAINQGKQTMKEFK